MSNNFHKQHYNLVAARIRETATEHVNEFGADQMVRLTGLAVLQHLAMKFAESFAKDNERFSPVTFLNACSPDTARWPWGDLVE